ncbi:hypothetical protein CS542_07430 [Pedobacter sp. IW39]|nr:hypothetical protein CS542_07430 [Pedobacter sp. IW39]
MVNIMVFTSFIANIETNRIKQKINTSDYKRPYDLYQLMQIEGMRKLILCPALHIELSRNEQYIIIIFI